MFITHYTGLYGANRSLLGLIDGIKNHGVKPYVLAPEEGAITEALSDRGITYYTSPFKNWVAQDRLKAPARLGMNLIMLPSLVLKVLQWNVDLIHTNSSVTPIGALLAEVLSLPHVWHVREFGEADYNLKYDWGETLFQTFMSRAEATIAVSEAVRCGVLSHVDSPCQVVYNGVISTERLGQLKQENDLRTRRDTSYTFAIVGVISPSKGQEQALRAFHQLSRENKDVHLLIAGDGGSEYVESLHELCHSLDLNQLVSFLGYVSDPFEVYLRADAVLMCSPHEAMGRVTAEAMATGRPVIGYDNAGTSELIDDERNGLLYDGTTDDLARCMHRLMNNPDWGYRLGEHGEKKAAQKFTNEVYAKKVYEVMCEAVGE
nr:glycosyltransferase family 4 protein [Salinibacter ruber]